MLMLMLMLLLLLLDRRVGMPGQQTRLWIRLWIRIWIWICVWIWVWVWVWVGVRDGGAACLLWRALNQSRLHSTTFRVVRLDWDLAPAAPEEDTIAKPDTAPQGGAAFIPAEVLAATVS